MSEDSTKKGASDFQPEYYEIRVPGIFDPRWSDWLGCQNVAHSTNETILSCEVHDQTALHGLLDKIRGLNLKMIFMARVEFVSDENEVDSHEDKKL